MSKLIKVLMLSIVLLLIFTLAACGDNDKVKETTENPTIVSLNEDKTTLMLADDLSNIVSNITLPTTGLNGSVVTWSSSNTAVLSDAGVVTRPATGAGDVTLKLTATLTLDGESTTKEFSVVVIELAYTIITELPNEMITLDFWHTFGTDNELLIQGYIDEFTAEHPNVTVNFTKESNNYAELRNKVVNNIRTGTTPDLVFTYPDHVADYIQGEAALALDPFINNEEVGYSQAELDNFVDAYMDENKQTGNYFGLPFNKSTEVLIYNKTYFEDKKGDAGFEDLTLMYNKLNPTGDAEIEVVSWDLIKKVSEEINTDTGKFGFAYESLVNLFTTLIRQHGGTYTNSDGDLLFNNDVTENALQSYRDMHTAGLATIPAEWEEDYASDPFIKKNVYMTVGSTAGINYNVPITGLFEIGVAPIPQQDLTKRAVIQQGTNITLMSNTTDAQRLAGWLLMKHLASDDVTTDWAMKTGYLPVTKSALESDAYQAYLTNPEEKFKYDSLAAKAAYLQTDYMFYNPAFPGSSNVSEKADTIMQAVVFNNTQTIKQLLQSAFDDLNG